VTEAEKALIEAALKLEEMPNDFSALQGDVLVERLPSELKELARAYCIRRATRYEENRSEREAFIRRFGDDWRLAEGVVGLELQREARDGHR
jgi:hypothetical protein